ncbi:MAG TPA: hypothetical protein VL358_04790 [Caulobacteraceae bacterium]|nr:hypothetical protein [Caulobacteraceae bacterium]
MLTLIDVAVPRAPTAAAQVGTIMEPHHRPGQPVLTAEALATWTDEEVRAAELYAGACYAVAGDNEVPVPEIPAKLAPYLPFSPFNLTGYGAPLVLVSGGDEAPWVGPFTDLAAINADGIAADELTAIARTILCDEIYQGGGSAAGEWTVQAVRVG